MSQVDATGRIEDSNDFNFHQRYIHENPVRARIVTTRLSLFISIQRILAIQLLNTSGAKALFKGHLTHG
jgi:hypothetical protein